MKKYLEIGKIVSVHGLKGDVKVEPWCNEPEFICEFDKLYSKDGKKEFEVERSRVQKNMVIMKLKGVDSVEEGQALRNKILFMDREDVGLEEGYYFFQDLIGLTVIDVDNQRVYGEIKDVFQTGANDVYHIKSEDGKEYYIPAIADVIIKTDLQDGKMYIRPLEGLFDED